MLVLEPEHWTWQLVRLVVLPFNVQRCTMGCSSMTLTVGLVGRCPCLGLACCRVFVQGLQILQVITSGMHAENMT